MQIVPEEIELVFETETEDEHTVSLDEVMEQGPPSDHASLIAAAVIGDPCFYEAVFTTEENVYLIFDDDTYVLLWQAHFPNPGLEVKCVYRPAEQE